MATKVIFIESVGEVQLTKRKKQKTIRLTVRSGVVKASQPAWLPYSAGEAFVKSRIQWIKEHTKNRVSFVEGQEIAGTRLTFTRSEKDIITSKQSSNVLEIKLPKKYYPEDTLVQEYTNKRFNKVLRDKSESYLPSRVKELAILHGFRYKSVQVRNLKSRWGSCNSKKELVFNINLMKLSSKYIDYVILHELTHTVHMNHGSDFWELMEKVMPGAKKIAKTVRRIQF